LIVGLTVRSCSPSRSVGHGAVEETCFEFWRGLQLPDHAAAHPFFERAQDAAVRSQDPALAADVSRAAKSYAGDKNEVALSDPTVSGVLAECRAKGWNATDPCTYGAAVCVGTARSPQTIESPAP
jgi:hypothetical protein